MANWRRERGGALAHLLTDGADAALCARETAELGATLWDARVAAPDLCRKCAGRMLAVTDLAIERIALVLAERTSGTKSGEERERSYEIAKEALRALARVVPAGVIADHVVYARACLVRGDPKDAHESLRTWRANMRAIGVFEVESPGP